MMRNCLQYLRNNALCSHLPFPHSGRSHPALSPSVSHFSARGSAVSEYERHSSDLLKSPGFPWRWAVSRNTESIPTCQKSLHSSTHRERIKNKRQYIFSLNLFYFLELLLLTYYLQLSSLASQRYVCEQLFIWFFCQKWPGQFIIIKELPPLV